MTNRVYYKFKKLLNKYYLLMLFLLIIIIVMIIPVPYVIEHPGKPMDLSTKIIMDSTKKTKGSINLTYVGEKNANIFTYLLSKIRVYEDAIEIDENSDLVSGKILLDNSLSNATYLAYNALEKELSIKESSLLVAYIGENAETDLIVGDEIKEVNGKKINDIDEYHKIVLNSKVGDKLIIKTKNKEKSIKIKSLDKQNNTYIYIVKNNKYDIDIKYNYKDGEIGSSAGLMMSLYIYNQLSNDDLINDKIITGTGTIDMMGNVGEIDGIKYKLFGADSIGASIFFVPEDNYIEARKIVKINNLNLKLVSVKTFMDAVNYLKSEI